MNTKTIVDIVITLLCFIGVFAAYIYGLYYLWSEYAHQTTITSVPCYNTSKINDYGELYPVCDTAILNGTKFLSYKNRDTCRNCMDKRCLDETEITVQTVGGPVYMNQCYQNISYKYFKDNCVECYPPDINGALYYTVFIFFAIVVLPIIIIFTVYYLLKKAENAKDFDDSDIINDPV